MNETIINSLLILWQKGDTAVIDLLSSVAVISLIVGIVSGWKHISQKNVRSASHTEICYLLLVCSVAACFFWKGVGSFLSGQQITFSGWQGAKAIAEALYLRTIIYSIVGFIFLLRKLAIVRLIIFLTKFFSGKKEASSDIK